MLNYTRWSNDPHLDEENFHKISAEFQYYRNYKIPVCVLPINNEKRASVGKINYTVKPQKYREKEDGKENRNFTTNRKIYLEYPLDFTIRDFVFLTKYFLETDHYPEIRDKGYRISNINVKWKTVPLEIDVIIQTDRSKRK